MTPEVTNTGLKSTLLQTASPIDKHMQQAILIGAEEEDCSPSNYLDKWIVPSFSQPFVGLIVGMNPISRHGLDVEILVAVDGHDATLFFRPLRCPFSNPPVQVVHSLAALGTLTGIQRNDLSDLFRSVRQPAPLISRVRPTCEDLHGRLTFSHRVHKFVVRAKDVVRLFVAPHVVRAEVHHDDVRLSLPQPAL